MNKQKSLNKQIYLAGVIMILCVLAPFVLFYDTTYNKASFYFLHDALIDLIVYTKSPIMFIESGIVFLIYLTCLFINVLGAAITMFAIKFKKGINESNVHFFMKIYKLAILSDVIILFLYIETNSNDFETGVQLPSIGWVISVIVSCYMIIKIKKTIHQEVDKKKYVPILIKISMFICMSLPLIMSNTEYDEYSIMYGGQVSKFILNSYRGIIHDLILNFEIRYIFLLVAFLLLGLWVFINLRQLNTYVNDCIYNTAKLSYKRCRLVFYINIITMLVVIALGFMIDTYITVFGAIFLILNLYLLIRKI